MYHPTTRVLTVLELLQSRGRITGPELAERLEVNGRTARRYIGMLQDLGIPIESERGRYGAYVLRPGFKLPPLMFGEDEALALVLGLLAARRIGLAAAAPAVEGALAKIERVLPPDLRRRIDAVQATLVLDLGRNEPQPAAGTVVTFALAAQGMQRVRLRYRAGDAEESEREFDPYGLVYHEGRWYAVGYCHMRRDLRTFRMDRIRAVDLAGASFTRPEPFDAYEHLIGALADKPGRWPTEVLLCTSLDEARALVPSSFATLEETTAGVVLRANITGLAWMARFLAHLGVPFVVRQPAELRAELRRLAATIAALAEAVE